MNKKALALLALLLVLAVGVYIGFRIGLASAPQPEIIQTPVTDPLPDPGQTDPPASEPEPILEPIPNPEPEPEPVVLIPTDPEPSGPDESELPEDGQYDTKDEVALYLFLYGHLPDNFVTKRQALDAGWSNGSLEPYFPGCSIGGDVFQNREGLLPKVKGRTYYECDIGTTGKKSRGSKRIVFSNDGLIYYTGDHYESFTLLYDAEVKVS